MDADHARADIEGPPSGKRPALRLLRQLANRRAERAKGEPGQERPGP